MIFSFKNPAKISTTSNNMGWRGDKLLLQGKVKTGEFFFLFVGGSSNGVTKWLMANFKEVGRVVVDAVAITSTWFWFLVGSVFRYVGWRSVCCRSETDEGRIILHPLCDL